MKALRALLARLRATVGGRGGAGDDFADELASHLALHEDACVQAGLPPGEARRLARARVGSLTALQQTHRDQRRFRPADAAARDLRHAVRLLWRSPLFTGVALVLLALGIGANTTVFTLANALVLRSLPVRAPERLALLDKGSWTYPIFEAIRQHDLGVEGVGAWANESMVVRVAGQGERAAVQFVSGGFYDVVGAVPAAGRGIDLDDDRRGGGGHGPVAVISHAYWQRRFGGDPAVLTRSLEIEGVSHAVVGVMAPGFSGAQVGQAFDVAIPFGVEPLIRGDASNLDRRSTWWLNILFRLEPGQTLEAAQQRLRAVQPSVRLDTMPEHYPEHIRAEYLSGAFELVSASNGFSPLRERYAQPLTILALTAALVLCVACANLANLLLARGTTRRPEMSARLALGASRARLVGQLLVEGLLLATLGALAGLGVAWTSSRVILALISSADRPVALDLSLDWRVLGFTAAAAVVTAVLCALVPAWRTTDVAPGDTLKEQSRSVAGDSRWVTTHALLATQVALSLALVVVAALLVRTFTTLAAQPLGFEPTRVVVASVELGRDAVVGDARGQFMRQLPERVKAIPGVEVATISSIAPMSGAGWNDAVSAIDGEPVDGEERDRFIWLNAVDDAFFETYGTALRAGRLFTAADAAGTPEVAIVNDAFVARYLPGRDPIGRLIAYGRPGDPPRLVIGRVADARYFRDLRREAPPTLYVPHAQLADAGGRVVVSVRARDAQLEPLRQALVTAIDAAGQPVSVRTQLVTDYVDGALSQERLIATVAGFFGGLALVIAGVGLYGVTAYTVGRRRAELGIRLTLGATPGHIVRLVYTRVAVVVAIGLAGGLMVALWLGTFVESLLHHLEPSDPTTLTAAALVLGLTATLAALVPAWRAAHTDPADVLRES